MAFAVLTMKSALGMSYKGYELRMITSKQYTSYGTSKASGQLVYGISVIRLGIIQFGFLGLPKE